MESIKDKTLLDVLGLRDISTLLYKRTLECIYKCDVVKGIRIDKEIEKNGEKIYRFEAEEYGLKGIIYPLDEIVHVGRICDIIIQNWKVRKYPVEIEAEIYHDCKRGERIPIIISRKDLEYDPSFKLFNKITGFVKNWGKNPDVYENIGIGSKVLVEVDHLWEKNRKIHVFVKPVEFLKDVR